MLESIVTVRMSRALDPPKRLQQRRDVEHVTQDFPVGFEDHRERSEPCRDAEEIRGALCVAARAACARPDGGAGAAVRVPRLRGISPRTAPSLRAAGRRALPLRRRRAAAAPDRRRFRLRKPDHEPIVGPHRLGVVAGLGADALHPPPSPMARGCVRRKARAGTCASHRARRACARSRWCGRPEPIRSRPPDPPG